MATTKSTSRRTLTRVNSSPRKASGGYRVGIDVGGTFTDLVLVRPDRSIHLDKTATTPHDQSEGVMNGLERLARSEGKDLGAFLAATDRIVHGTTTADNTMIQMNGAVTGLITSEGHRDEIEMRRGFKESIWDPSYPPPPPICPRRRRLGVPERLDYEGKVVEPLDEDALRKALRRLKLQNIESLAIVFLFSFVNPAHEKRAAEIAAEELPGVDLSLSHQVMPQAPHAVTVVVSEVSQPFEASPSQSPKPAAQVSPHDGAYAPSAVFWRSRSCICAGLKSGCIARCF